MSVMLPRALRHLTLDEVAECTTVSRETYAALWRAMPPDDEIPPQGEWPEPDSPDRRARSLEKHWDRLTEEQQRDVIRACVEEGWT